MRSAIHLFLLCLISELNGQFLDSACIQQKIVLKNLLSYHYSPPVFNEVTNGQVLDIFIREADERNIIFLAQDKVNLVGLLLKNKTDDIYCLLIREAFEMYMKRLSGLDSIVTSLESRQTDFNAADTLTFATGKRDRMMMGSLSGVSRRIEKHIKYECLANVAAPKKDSFNVNTASTGELQQLKNNAKKKAIKRFRQYLSQFKDANYLAHHLANCMSNALAQRCDPHSNFFNVYQMKHYSRALSTEESSFGFSVSEDENGNIAIEDLVPGGPAWKSNALNEKDVILAFRFDEGEEIEADNFELDYFIDQFIGSEAKWVELKVRKKDLSIKKVKLKKELMLSHENILNSYLLHYNSVKMGYIPIPSFYLDQENDSRQGCANDVAKEIIKLKHDSVKGIIIDLRYNGGGSLREAMSLAGIFIDEGPLAIYKPRSGKPFVLKDLNRGSIWDQPLVILVNSASASASEFVAATLQDYNRAPVVGSVTFGKGTAQCLMMTDSTPPKNKWKLRREFPSLGYMKVTEGKFYRLTSESHQGKGIQPDIEIPGVVEKIMEKENDYPWCLSGDTVDKKVAYKRSNTFPKEELAGLSKKRVEASRQFNKIKVIADSIQRLKTAEDKIPLTLKDVKKYIDRENNFHLRMDDLFSNPEEKLHITNNTENQKINSMSDYHKKYADNAIENLKKDLTLQETVYILNDLISLSK